MIESDDISDLEAFIRWGVVSTSHQTEFEKRVRCHPNLALDADEFGTTLLMVAAGAGNFVAAELLVKLGADVNVLNQSGETALINVVREAENENEQSSDEIQARLKIIDVLMSHGADPNLLGYQGCSVFHWAVIYGQVNFVDRLLHAGAQSEILLNDPPDCQTVNELVHSPRFLGTDEQRKLIAEMLNKHMKRKE